MLSLSALSFEDLAAGLAGLSGLEEVSLVVLLELLGVMRSLDEVDSLVDLGSRARAAAAAASARAFFVELLGRPRPGLTATGDGCSDLLLTVGDSLLLEMTDDVGLLGVVSVRCSLNSLSDSLRPVVVPRPVAISLKAASSSRCSSFLFGTVVRIMFSDAFLAAFR